MRLEAPMWIGVVVGLQCIEVCRWVSRFLDGGFLKWWYPTTMGFMGFPTKNDHFGVFWGEQPPFKETPRWWQLQDFWNFHPENLGK